MISILFRRFRKVNAQPDIASIVAGARDPEIAALEKRLAELQRAEIEAGAEWGRWRDRADPNISTLVEAKTADTIEAAKLKLAEVAQRRASLQQEAAEIRTRISCLVPASLAAIAAALAPTRARAARDIQDSRDALYAAIELHNSTTEALVSNGATDVCSNSIPLPQVFAIVDHFIERVTKS